MRVELGIERKGRLVVIPCPPPVQRWLFIVDEEASVLDAWLSLYNRLTESEDIVMFLRRDVGKEVILVTSP